MPDILCFGDSITFGEGENGGWCGRLKIWFEGIGENNGIYNLGIPGETLEGLLQRFDAECKARLRFKYSFEKYTILIAIGTNDTKYIGAVLAPNQYTNTETFTRNIQDILQKSKKMPSKTAFIGLPPVDEARVNKRERGEQFFTNTHITEFNNIIKNACKKEKIPFLDINKRMLAEDYTAMLSDGLHPNSKGYDFMFKIIKEFIEENDLLP
ncbi:MAG: GDSL-type esterase/lipase family protein [Candidatus Diapherotrites archaeon]|nr:GDSL-type esterase/lipase family protein [Candidatus Diapherotrites archaeon]